MRLTVLGGSAAGPNTGQGCSGYLVDTGRAKIVLDLGPGTLPELRRHIDFRAIDAIVISHLHVDHVLDLVALRFALAYNPVRPVSPVLLWMPPGGLAFLSAVGTAFDGKEDGETFFSEHYSIAEYDPGSSLTIGNAQVTFTPTVHYVPCWAIRLSVEGTGALLYTADTGPDTDFSSLGDGVDVLVGDSGQPEPVVEESNRGHSTAAEMGYLGSKLGVKALVLAHLWEEVGRDTYLARAASTFGGRIVVAMPGTTVEW